MDVTKLNNLMILKRFREQLLFGRFETIDFETEILKRIGYNNIDILNKWKDQLKSGVFDDIDHRKLIIKQFEREK